MSKNLTKHSMFCKFTVYIVVVVKEMLLPVCSISIRAPAVLHMAMALFSPPCMCWVK